MHSAQIILTQACSDLESGKTSGTNVWIAAMAAQLSNEFGIGIFSQGEVTAKLRQLGVEVAGSTRIQSTANPFEDEYLDTWGVAQEQAAYCRKNGITRVLVMHYVPHVWRVMWCYKRLGLEVIVPPDLPIMVYEEGLQQKRLSSPWTLYPFELAARLVYWWKGYI